MPPLYTKTNVMKVRGFLYGLISSATFGLIPLFSIPALENGIGLNSLLFYRFSLATLLIGVILLVKKISFRITRQQLGVLFILGALYAITALLLTEAYLYIPSGVATTIHFLYPVIVSLIMFFCFKDRLTAPVLIAMILAISGVYMLSGSESGGTIHLRGLMLVLVTVVTYATYIVGMSRSRAAGMDSLAATFYILGSGAFIFMLNLALHGQWPDPMPDTETTINVLMVALLPTLVSDLTLILAVRYIGSTTTAILGCMEPLTAVCMGFLFLGERLSASQITGISIVLLAVTLVIAGDWVRKWVRGLWIRRFA